MSQPSFVTVGILIKPDSPQAQPVLNGLIAWLERRGKTVLVARSPAGPSDTQDRLALDALASQSDLLIVLGGDGTMLSASRLVEQRGTPILGVNMGGLGFLTETTIEHLYPSLNRVLAGDYCIEQRLMLRVGIHRNQTCIRTATVLNDAVISKGPLARMISIKIEIDKAFMTNLRGDGVILATPTGSTAYSLSAGGPILDPSLNVLILNPICPHTLSHRPFLVASHALIEILLKSQEKAMVTFDGQSGMEVFPGDVTTIQASEHRAHLIRFPDRSFYDVLRTKLKWGDG
ncbi:MAG: NAD(+)/NADH kinase [Nitrospirae bacterium]|nr:MAG: NAD(+)/NADH kinase [Nitrospirota bacterium]